MHTLARKQDPTVELPMAEKFIVTHCTCPLDSHTVGANSTHVHPVNIRLFLPWYEVNWSVMKKVSENEKLYRIALLPMIQMP